ncbi:predicted protein [Thalassiosira pseudonana CCMP1335]|uniref:Uncharacterized protein n=1 Tax=Thalassiosira pseudonana TaxID=35128 RepID=B8C3V0_THAPS|nr:predicted protein [Thalassiosira pseudonana CCMP1335]EED92189.1 predicted protein [Thalassiosira pseudonana CCMP1335]
MPSSQKNSSPKVIGHSDRPYHRYNLFYILERELILETFGVNKSDGASSEECSKFNQYADLHLQFPVFPARYRSISTLVGKSWKTADPETMNFVNVAAKLLLSRRDELLSEAAGSRRVTMDCNTNPCVKSTTVTHTNQLFCQAVYYSAVPQGQGMDTNVSSQNSQLFCQLIPSPIQYSSVCSITSPLSCESFLKATSSSPRLPLSDAPSEHDTTSYRISEVDVSDDAIMNMWNECEITPFGRGVFRNAKTA